VDTICRAFILEMSGMPYKPKHPCAEQGCPALIPAGEKYCPLHKKRHPEEERSAASRGYDAKWQRFRKWYLSQPENMFCRSCLKEGIYRKATVVDHIKPFRGDEKLKYDLNNLQPLCKACHDKKTGEFDSRPEYRY
jgi:5-methylcytosine-specific restriction protein A